MDDFVNKTFDGEWWNPKKPEIIYQGTLSFNKNLHGTFIIKGKQSDLLKLWDPKNKQRVFYGRLSKKYTYEVTLFDVGMIKGPNVSTSKIDRDTTIEFFTNHVLVGAHIESEKHPFLDGAYLNLTGLEDWSDVTGISGKHRLRTPGDLSSQNVNLKYKGISTPHYNLGNGRLIRFLSQYTGPIIFGQQKKIVIEERKTIELVFTNSVSIKDLLAEVHIWQTFLSLGLRQPSYIDKVTILVSTGGQNFTSYLLIVPTIRPERPQLFRSPETILFSQSGLGRNLRKCLQSWRRNHDTLSIPILLFTGTTYQENNYAHANLLIYLQALEVLHAEKYKKDKFPNKNSKEKTLKLLRKAVPKFLKPELQKELSEGLGYVGSLRLIDRLNHLYDLHKKCLKPIFPNKKADMRYLKDVRNFLTHYGKQKKFGQEFLWSREIFVLKEKANLFFEICLLSAMGLTNDQIFTLVRSFRPYINCTLEKHSPQ